MIMKTVKILTTVDLTEGGCNACGITKSTVYTLNFDNHEANIDELSVQALVQAIVQMSGWRQELIMDLLGDYVVFRKDSQEVQVKESFQGLTYEKALLKEVVSGNSMDSTAVFHQTNKILEDFFSIEPLVFEL